MSVEAYKAMYLYGLRIMYRLIAVVVRICAQVYGRRCMETGIGRLFT
jgi:hypothetical protein